jgi:hypothetical protein
VGLRLFCGRGAARPEVRQRRWRAGRRATRERVSSAAPSRPSSNGRPTPPPAASPAERSPPRSHRCRAPPPVRASPRRRRPWGSPSCRPAPAPPRRPGPGGLTDRVEVADGHRWLLQLQVARGDQQRGPQQRREETEPRQGPTASDEDRALDGTASSLPGNPGTVDRSATRPPDQGVGVDAGDRGTDGEQAVALQRASGEGQRPHPVRGR